MTERNWEPAPEPPSKADVRGALAVTVLVGAPALFAVLWLIVWLGGLALGLDQ